MNLTDYYQEFYNSDPYELMRAASSELQNIAACAGIDWMANAGSVQLVNGNGKDTKFRTYTGRPAITLEKGLKGRADLYSRVEDKKGLKVPFINFVCKGAEGGSWSGYSWLWDAYEQYRQQIGTTVPMSADKQRQREERLRQQAERKAAQEEKARINWLMSKQLADQNLLHWLAFNQAFASAPNEDGSFPYAVDKQISPVFPFCNVRRMRVTEFGVPQDIIAIPLVHLDDRYAGKIVSWQRIYSTPRDNEKYPKRQTSGVETLEYPGACHVIGELRGAKRIAVAEGFATGASAYIAEMKKPEHERRFQAVVVAVSANNMKPVVEQLVDMYEGAEIWCLLDNDRAKAAEGKGNTGLLTGLEIMERWPDVHCAYPTFSDEYPNASDWNDLYVIDGPTETRRQLKAKANRLEVPSNGFIAALMKFDHIARDKAKIEKHVMTVIGAGMNYCPSKMTPSMLVECINGKLDSLGFPMFAKKVRLTVRRFFNSKCREAQIFRSFSSDITSEDKRPAHITYKRFSTPHITPAVLAYIRSCEGPVIVRAGMGSGKTKHLLRPMMQSAERGIFAAHRVTLIGGAHLVLCQDDDAKRINTDILHYQDEGYQEQAPYAAKLAICLNSIVKGCWKPLMRRHDFFGLDEATQGLRAILSGKAMENPVAVFNQLIDCVARTEGYSLMVDADANDSLVRLCELAMKRREKLHLPAWQQIHVIELPVDVSYTLEGDSQPVKRKVRYTDADRIVVEALKAAELGEKFILATDSTAFAEQLLFQLRDKYPTKNWLYVSQDTKPDPAVKLFADDPNGEAVRYDGLIYSPAISSGVSIEVRHFTRHFGMFCGQIVPSDAIQMLRRDRKATEFVIGLKQLPGRKEDDATNIRRGYLDAMLRTNDSMAEFFDAEIDGTTLHLGLADTDYARMKMEMAGKEAKARNGFENNLICILFDDGYDVNRLADDVQASATGKQLRKVAKERVWDESVARHLGVETPSDAERERLENLNFQDVDQKAQLVRWEIEHELQLPVDVGSLEFHDQDGRRKLSRLELMSMPEETAVRIDREQSAINFTYQFKGSHRAEFIAVVAHSQKQADEKFKRLRPDVTDPVIYSHPQVEVTQRTFATVKREKMREYFTACGIDPDTFEGVATVVSMTKARDLLMNQKDRDLFNNVLNFGGFMSRAGKPKCPVAVFQNICGSVGLDAVSGREGRNGKRFQTVSPNSVKFMKDILERRAEKGKTFYQSKVEKPDPDRMLYIESVNRSGSPAEPVKPQVSEVEKAIEGTPIPASWLKTTLTLPELQQLAALPLKLIRATLSGLYLTENMDNLDAGVYKALKRLQAG